MDTVWAVSAVHGEAALFQARHRMGPPPSQERPLYPPTVEEKKMAEKPEMLYKYLTYIHIKGGSRDPQLMIAYSKFPSLYKQHEIWPK